MSTPARVRFPSAIVLLGLVASGAVSAPADAGMSSTDATRAAGSSVGVLVQPGGHVTASWTGRSHTGVGFSIPTGLDDRVAVGVLLRPSRSATTGYRVVVEAAPDGSLVQSVAQVSRGREVQLGSSPVDGGWKLGDVIAVEARIHGSKKVGLSVRTSTNESVSPWMKVVDRSPRIAGSHPALAWVGLGAAASRPVTLDLVPLSVVPQLRAAQAVSPTPVDVVANVPSSSPAVAMDEFGPVGHAPTPAELDDFGWNGVQAPRSDSITMVDSSVGVGTNRPIGPLMRASLWEDELYDGRPRAEVYGRRPTPWTTAPDQWIDHAGTQRWYSFDLLIPSGFALRTDVAWLDLTQWKGYHGGSPPIAIEIKKDYLRLGGDRTNHNKVANDGKMGAVVPGQWTHITVGIRFSTSADDGWVEAWRDGRQVVTRTPVATMDTYQGAPDPIYFKQGIYRSAAWDVRQAVYFSRVAVTDTQPSRP